MEQRLGTIERLATLWHEETRPATRWACVAALVAGLVAAALLGRAGAPWSRALAGVVLVVGLVPTILRALVARRRARDPRAAMRATLGRAEPELGRAALRAMALTEDTDADPARGSSELARLHLARVLGRASIPALRAHAARVAWLVVAATMAVTAVTFGAVMIDPFRVVEGVDVLAAQDGVAPVPVPWLEGVRMQAEPPSYLHLDRRSLRPHFPTALHVGTTVTVRGVPRHDGRALVLTDGRREVPFADDGGGAAVARWTVDGDATLFVAARFGGVIVPEPERLEVHAIADHAPVVRLEGAPREVRLLERPRVAVHWEAFDDHGLREVALVLRSGDREVRRPLSTPQGSAMVDRGGIELGADDPFLEQSYLPIELTVEALDDDPITGPKWGRSDAMLLLPPQIGEREAMRFSALKAGRDRLTDLLADRLTVKVRDAAAHRAAEASAQAELDALFAEVLGASYGGLRLRGRLAALVRGQLEQMRKAVAEAARLPSPKAEEARIAATENALLAIDSGLGALGAQDTRLSALKLAEAATEAAAAITRGRDPREREHADRLLFAHLDVLVAGGRFMTELGALGRDLGELVDSGVRRIERPFAAGDRYHARLAAEDLAARLRRPDPSFGSAGGRGHGGVESGGVPQPGEGEPSEAAEQMEGLEDALEALRQEHARELDEVDRALQDALRPEEQQALKEQLRDTARRVREAVEGLPQQASDPASARAAAAEARSQAEAMADALERGDLGQAMDQGQRALGSLDQAEQRAREAPASSSEREVGAAAGAARGALDELMREGQSTLQQMHEQASKQAQGALDQAAKRERELAERARRLGEESAGSEAPLPGEMLDHLEDAARKMEEAARSLERGEGARGQEKQREAQRLLEMSQPERDGDAGEPRREGEGKDFARDADVPPEARDKRAEDFRRRVTEGLGKSAPPHLREAIRRYTEGLLR